MAPAVGSKLKFKDFHIHLLGGFRQFLIECCYRAVFPHGKIKVRGIQLDSATLTGIINRLARAGLVERENNPDDRRAVLICLTEKGKAVGNEILGIIEPANREPANRAFLSNRTPEEEVIFRTLLRKVLSRNE